MLVPVKHPVVYGSDASRMRSRLVHDRVKPAFLPHCAEKPILAPLEKGFPPSGVILRRERVAKFFVTFKETWAAALQLLRDAVREFSI
jgi:hypothetical protein